MYIFFTLSDRYCLQIPKYLSEAGGVDRLHAVLAAEVDVVEVHHVPRDAHALRQLVVTFCDVMNFEFSIIVKPQ